LHARKSRAAPHPIFGDIRVRQALTMAVDRARVMRLALDTFATVSIGPAPRALIAYPDSVRQLPFDVAHAKALLDSAGWVTVPGKSTREKNGMPLAFEALVTSSSAPRVAYAQLLEQQWAAIGAKLTVRVLAASVIGQQMGSHDFDAWFGAYTVTPGLAAVPAAWGSRGFTNGRNYGGYSNAQFDATVDSALNAPSAARANVLWVRALNVSNADAPALWMYEEQSLGLLNRRIQPKTLRRDAWYAYLADWTIDPAQRIDRDRIGLGVGR
jgi:peptide/nickel transport system substrate-binding protein